MKDSVTRAVRLLIGTVGGIVALVVFLGILLGGIDSNPSAVSDFTRQILIVGVPSLIFCYLLYALLSKSVGGIIKNPPSGASTPQKRPLYITLIIDFLQIAFMIATFFAILLLYGLLTT